MQSIDPFLQILRRYLPRRKPLLESLLQHFQRDCLSQLFKQKELFRGEVKQFERERIFEQIGRLPGESDRRQLQIGPCADEGPIDSRERVRAIGFHNSISNTPC